MKKYLCPKYFLLGICLGFLLCSSLGYWVSKKARLHHFSRFFDAIDPEALYYPTASELLGTVRHDVSHDKILVLIGGSSITRGTGQDPNELWSLELQSRLGNKFKVINYATNAASLSSYGGVVFRMLRNEYPKLIFVAAVSQFNPGSNINGLEPYDYLFWDAYYKNLFNPYAQEAQLIKKIRKNDLKTAKGMELHIANFLDSFFYFKDLWNWISYHFIFTVWSAYNFSTPFKPRHDYYEKPIDPKYKKILLEVYRDKEHLQIYTKLIKSIETKVVLNKQHQPLQVNSSVILNSLDQYRNIFQSQDRAKILCIQTAYNPYAFSLLSNDIKKIYWFYTDQSRFLMESLGYSVLNVGKDYADNDFLDLTHFTASGGQKLAIETAAVVMRLAKKNKYL